MMDIQTIKEMAPYIGAVATFLAGIYKDRILNALNIKKMKKEVDSSTSDVIEKNLKLYQEMIDDLDERHNKRIDTLEASVDKMRVENESLRKDRDNKASEVSKLREEIHEIKAMLGKALKQLDYYKQNSDIELPEDLQ